MAWLEVAHLVNVLGAFIVTILGLSLGLRYPSAFYRPWTACFASMLGYVSIEALTSWVGRPMTLSVLEVALLATSAWYCDQTLWVLSGRYPSRRSFAVLVLACTVLSLVLLGRGLPFTLALVPIATMMCLGFCRLGYAFIRQRHDGQAGRYGWVGWPLLLFGSWPFVYPYPLLVNTAYAWIGYAGSGVFHVWVGLGMVIYLLDEHRHRYEREQDRIHRLKNDFVSVVSHELRTPLTSIMGFSEFLEDELGGPLSPLQIDYVRQIQEGTRRLQHLVNDLLDFSMLEGGNLKLDPRPTDLCGLAREVTESLKPQAAKAHIDLLAHVPPQPVTITGDRERLEQVIINLMGNSLKFTPPGGRITLSIRTLPSEIRLEVEDTGIGIAPDRVATIFDKFVQADASTTRQRNGVGLGLAIAKAIVESHGGRIGCQSKEGAGSRFWVSLPESGRVLTSSASKSAT